MSTLPLPHFIVRGFRCFDDLRVEGLGRVNLIVGKNSVGKTALLEAIEVYASAADPLTLIDQLSRREETFVSTNSLFLLPENDFAALFRGRRPIVSRGQVFETGTEQRMLSVGIEERSAEGHPMATPAMVARLGGIEQVYWFDVQYSARIPNRLASQQLNHSFATSDMTRSSALAEMWEHVDLTPEEGDVVKSLQLVQPQVLGLSFLRGDNANGNKRVAYVKLAGSDARVPVGSLGEGMSRVLALSMALVNAKDGILLVDEIENGIHYSVQESVWSFVFSMAERLNTQVFATTHSWDCVQTFQAADRNGEGRVVRLEDKKGRIMVSMFEERDLEVVARENIEIR